MKNQYDYRFESGEWEIYNTSTGEVAADNCDEGEAIRITEQLNSK